MKLKLQDITEIQTGYTFRNGLNKYENGKLGVIQIKDLKGSKVDLDNIDYIDDDSIKENHFINKGDVLFKSRGEDNSSYIIEKDINAVAAAPIIVLKVRNKTVLPAYLNWFLNQTDAKEYLKSVSKGTLQKMISISALQEMEIDIPSKNTQKAIVELNSLMKKETEIMESLIIKRNNLITQKLLNLIKGE